jgi:hypothetical protein
MTIANEIVGALVLALGVITLVLRSQKAADAALKVLRCRSLDVALMLVAAGWFLWIVSQLGEADFGNYKVPLFIAFLGIAVGAILWVRDFLGVRAFCTIFMLASWYFLGAAFGHYEVPARLFMVGVVYAGLVATLYLAAIPYRVRDISQWLPKHPAVATASGSIIVALGAWLMIVPAIFY